MKTAKVIAYITVACIFAVIISVSLLDKDLIIAGHAEDLIGSIMKQDLVEITKEGNCSSKGRWERIQKNLKYIKIGMKKLEVIKLLGYPDGIEFSPASAMQFSIDGGVYNSQQRTESIHIILNKKQKVIEVQRNFFVYGPQPIC